MTTEALGLLIAKCSKSSLGTKRLNTDKPRKQSENLMWLLYIYEVKIKKGMERMMVLYEIQKNEC